MNAQACLVIGIDRKNPPTVVMASIWSQPAYQSTQGARGLFYLDVTCGTFAGESFAEARQSLIRWLAEFSDPFYDWVIPILEPELLEMVDRERRRISAEKEAPR